MIKGFYLNPRLDRVQTQPIPKQTLQTSKSQILTELSTHENTTKISNRIFKDFNPYGLAKIKSQGMPVISPKKTFSKVTTPVNTSNTISKTGHSRATKSLSKPPLEEFVLKNEVSPKSNNGTISRDTISRERFVNPPRTSYTRFEDEFLPRTDSAFNPLLSNWNSRIVIRKKKSRSPSTEVTQTIFTDNMKKYRLVTVPGIKIKTSKSTASLASPKAVIRDIKNLINIHLKSPPQKRKQAVKLQAMNDINLTVSNKSEMTREDELKILAVKKKIHISNTFDKLFEAEQKKSRYKEYLMEYHPDKGKYDKTVCDEITNFLLLNKYTFLGMD